MIRFTSLALLLFATAFVSQARADDTYKVDPVHAFALFRATHVNTGHVWGRFNDPTGTFSLNDSDPGKCTFNIELQAANVDTHNDKRDAHLKSPDFFNAKQYPTITFKSSSVKKGEGNILQVTGALQIHGVTKTITIPVKVLGKGEFPPGSHRAGLEANFSVKLSDYEIKGLPGAVGDEIKVTVSVEGVLQ